jgi:uncharacterized DUF497 family protein
MSVRFEWDKHKAAVNIRIHAGVSFDEASTVFDDALASIYNDPGHSTHETGEIIIGHSIRNRLLLVCFAERAKDVVRIYSAGPVTRRERMDYEESITR